MIENAKNPRWADSGKTKIVLDVKIEGENEWVPFVASPTDCTEYGPRLYNSAVNGEFGEIADSDEERIIAGELPCPEGYAVVDGQIVDTAAVEREAEAELNRRLAELNGEEAKARAELNAEYAAERKEKMAALLTVRKQDGWPLEVEWGE